MPALIILALPWFIQCGASIVTRDSYDLSVLKKSVINYQSPSWETRLEAVQELVNSGTGEGNKLLEMTYLVSSSDSHPAVRLEAIKGLASIKSTKSVGRLREMALGDDSPNIRWQSIKTLTVLKDPASLDVFMRCYDSDDWLTREASIEGIMKFSGIAPHDTVISYAEKGLKDPNESVRMATLRNLAVKDESLYPTIREIFRNVKKTSHPMLNAALMAMKGFSLDRQTREEMIDLLGHRNLQIRILALRVLKQEIINRSVDQ